MSSAALLPQIHYDSSLYNAPPPTSCVIFFSSPRVVSHDAVCRPAGAVPMCQGPAAVTVERDGGGGLQGRRHGPPRTAASPTRSLAASDDRTGDDTCSVGTVYRGNWAAPTGHSRRHSHSRRVVRPDYNAQRRSTQRYHETSIPEHTTESRKLNR